jgi:enoyl-CoA hydratase/carnithine racemase
MSYTAIDYRVEEGIATVTLSRPEKLNAFSYRMIDEVLDVLDRIDADDDVRAVIFTGAGRAFSAGTDITDGTAVFTRDDEQDALRKADGSFDYGAEAARDGGGLISLRLYRCLKPVIAAINGPAVGIGATITLAMDIRLASDTAGIGFVFARRGIVPEAASAFFLPRLVGIGQALDWCYSGKVVPAAEAQAAGLFKAVHAPDDLLPAARAIAREIADRTAPVAIALVRQMMWRGLGYSHPMEAHQVDSRGILARGCSADVAEGVAAFLEKRPAQFTDRVSTDMPDYFPWWSEPSYR